MVLKFGDMIDIKVKLCKRVSKFKMLGSKAGPLACPKSPKLCPDYFSLTTEVIVLKIFLDMINIDVYFILNSEINAYQKQIKVISITSEMI